MSTTADPGRRLQMCLALSGCAGLVHEVAWLRLLRLGFGATSAAVAAVLAAFMAGLALGSFLGGRLAERRSPRTALRVFAACELAAALLALASAFLLARFPAAYALLERAVGDGRLLRLACAGVLLLPPTIAMGATLPLLVRAGSVLGVPAERGLASLYAANTWGAVAGSLAGGFVLLPWLGVSRSILVAVALEVFAALLALRNVRALDSPSGASAPAPVATAGVARRTLLFVSAALSGAVGLGLEALWNRTLVLTVGSSTQTFALVLATFLAGIALGSTLYARLGTHVRFHGALAGLCQLGVAVLCIALLHLAAVLPLRYLDLWDHLHGSGIGLALLRLLPAVALVLVPTVLMGASLPALARADGNSVAGIGVLYAANTAGAIVGAPLAGLVLLPALGVSRSTAVLAMLGALGAGAALLADARAGSRVARRVLFALPATGLLFLLLPRLDPRVMARGIAYQAEQLSMLRQQGRLDAFLESARVLVAVDGADASVLVYDTGVSTPRAFVVNGRHEASSVPHDRRNQVLLGHLPALLHRGPVQSGLVVALGSGMTAGCLALHAQEVTVVELERAVELAAREFAAWNHGVLENPRVRVVFDDGRHFLLRSDELFDVITVDPIHPMVAGSESLYSLEHYRLVRARLAPGGVAAQWLPLYQMGLEDLRTVAGTFRAVFEDAQVWINGYDAILIGGTGPTLPDAHEIRDALARGPVAASLASVGMENLGTFLAGFAVCAADLSEETADARLSRDDRPVLEFSLPWLIDSDTIDRNLLELYRWGRQAPSMALDGLTAAEREEIEQANSAVALSRIALALRLVGHEQSMRELFERALALDPGEVHARRALAR